MNYYNNILVKIIIYDLYDLFCAFIWFILGQTESNNNVNIVIYYK